MRTARAAIPAAPEKIMSPQIPPQRHGQAVDQVKAGNGTEKAASDGHRLRGQAKHGNQRLPGHQNQHRQAQGDADHHHRPRFQSLSGPLRLPGAYVLCHHRVNAGTEVNHGQQQDSVHPVGGSDGGHRLLPKAVHKPLEENVSHRVCPGLDGRRQTEPAAPGGHRPVHTPPARLEAQHGVLFHGVQHQKDGHHPLGEDGGRRRPCRAVPQHHHKGHVQHHIDPRAHQDGQEGGPAVPHTPQDGGIGVVDGQKGHAGEHDSQIALRDSKNIRWRVHRPQDGRGEEQAQGGHRRKNAPQKQRKGGQEPAQPALLPHAVRPGGQHREPAGKAGDDHDKEAVEGGGGSNPGQGQLPLHVAHNKGVHPVKQLLEYPAQHQRHSKGHHCPGDAPLNHIPLHMSPSQLNREALKSYHTASRRTTGVTHERLSH